jgi:hypothetical protein
MNTRALITGVVMLLATGTAHAADPLVCGTEQGSCRPYKDPKFPEYWLGRWCRTPYGSTEAQEIYFRPEKCCCSDMTDGITIDQKGYEDEAPSDEAPVCLFDNIKQSGRDTYLVHVHCKEGDKPSFEGDEEFQLVNGLLFKKRMPEG